MTTNPYLQIPKLSPDIMVVKGFLDSGSPRYENPRSGQISLLGTRLEYLLGIVPEPGVQGTTEPQIEALIGSLEALGSAKETFNSWTSNQIANLDSRLGTAKQSALYLGNIGQINPSAPCALFDTFFSTLSQAGSDVLSSALGPLTSGINAITNDVLGETIGQITSEINAAAGAITTLVANETAALSNVLASQVASINAVFSSLSILRDPCLAPIMNAVATPGFKNSYAGLGGLAV